MDGVDVLSTTNAHEVLATTLQMKDRCRADKAIAASAKAVKGGRAVAYPSYPYAAQTFTGTRTVPFILAAACQAGQGQTVRLISGLSGKRQCTSSDPAVRLNSGNNATPGSRLDLSKKPFFALR
ncbi:hypothetical protein GO003_003865 [Methylicorpusculum oleiharenae]|uniref:hypothetical protein n=1 Tax=Methylicorpusculum oleiharenae TaxID=1338687 RepID=UPI0013581D5A|nr:hypothetical protein [Methylicorpusculum oleiharenae]MCD2449520.1 hypothetical protein [Methylicorpusculum oleiharenae]